MDSKRKAQPESDELMQRNEDASKFEQFVTDSGVNTAFQLIFSELISKQIKPEFYYNYTAMRLRQIGKEIEELKDKISSKS